MAFFVECVSNGIIFLKCLSTLFVRFFGSVRKFLKLEKLKNMMMKQSIKKKRFHLLKKHLYQNEKAQNMPVVAGRLVCFFRQQGVPFFWNVTSVFKIF